MESLQSTSRDPMMFNLSSTNSSIDMDFEGMSAFSPQATSTPTDESSLPMPPMWDTEFPQHPLDWLETVLGSEETLSSPETQVEQQYRKGKQENTNFVLQDELIQNEERHNCWIKLSEKDVPGKFVGKVQNVEKNVQDNTKINIVQVAQMKHRPPPPPYPKTGKEKVKTRKVQQEVRNTHAEGYTVKSYVTQTEAMLNTQSVGRPRKTSLPRIVKPTQPKPPVVVEVTMDDLAALTSKMPPTPASVQKTLKKHCVQGMQTAVQAYESVIPIIQSATNIFFMNYALSQNLPATENTEAEQHLQQRIAALQMIHKAGELAAPVTSVVRTPPMKKSRNAQR